MWLRNKESKRTCDGHGDTPGDDKKIPDSKRCQLWGEGRAAVISEAQGGGENLSVEF
jgi:hypothetical protein